MEPSRGGCLQPATRTNLSTSRPRRPAAESARLRGGDPSEGARRMTSAFSERPRLAGQRPSVRWSRTSVARLHLSLLGEFERVVDLDTQVADSAFKLGV